MAKIKSFITLTPLTFVVVVVAMIFIASSFSLYSIFHPRCDLPFPGTSDSMIILKKKLSI
jgi:hypothetical protein